MTTKATEPIERTATEASAAGGASSPPTSSDPAAPAARRSDVGNWARTSADPGTARPSGVRRQMGAIQGFGKLWQKTTRVRLDGAAVTPEEVIATWKAHFPEFWPERQGKFHAPLTGLELGEVARLELRAPGGLKLSTGVMVLYSDEESFTFMTPEGHMFAGWITFSAFRDGPSTVAQVQILMRAQDPIGEIGLTLGGHRMENAFWEQTLANVASRFGVQAVATTESVCVDARRQWRRAGNLRHDIVIHSSIRMAGAPVRWLRERAGRGADR
jgi:hypothetical protein